MPPDPTTDVDILLVEDNLPDVRLTQRAFAKARVRNTIHVAVDGVEALDFLFRRGRHTEAVRPDLILLDMKMPRKGGREVLAELQADESLRTIPVIVLTTSSTDQDVKAAYALGANAYVVKPLTFTGFADAVTTIEGFWFDLVLLPGA